MTKMIEATNITSAYGKHRILKGASFSSDRGSCIAIVGANGSGKSTLLKILAGMIKPTGGTLSYYGHDALGNKEVCRKMVGYVPQDNPLIEELSVYDNLRLWYPDKAKLEQSLDDGFLHALGVQNFLKKKAADLSGGMKKKVNIGIALGQTPPVLILDEPGAALDLPSRQEINEYLKYYLGRQGTILITTHEESELALCDRILVMHEGQLVEVDPTLRGRALTAYY